MCHFQCAAKPCCYVTPRDYLAGFAVGGEVKLESLDLQSVFLGVAGRAGKVVQVVSEVERGSEKEEGGGLSIPV